MEILPCPFCGHKDIIIDEQESDFIYKDGTPMRGTFYYAECKYCGCSIGPAPSKEMLVNHWNSRVGK